MSERPRQDRPERGKASLRRVIWPAMLSSFVKLDPREMARNPVMFVVEVGSVITTIYFVLGLVTGRSDTAFVGQVAGWLWFTVLFANFATSMAEGRGKAQAETLRKTKTETLANTEVDGVVKQVKASELRKGDVVVVCGRRDHPRRRRRHRGDRLRGRVGDHRRVGAGHPRERRRPQRRHRRHAGALRPDQGADHLGPGRDVPRPHDRLVEGAERQKTPNEIALNILLAGLTIIFLIVIVTLEPFAIYSRAAVSVTVLIALLVCLIPTTIGGLLSAIGIAGMDRLVRHNVLAMSGRAVEAAGDVDTLLLDKTGTITLGNRQASEFIPVPGVTAEELADAAQLASLADETPEGRSIVVLAKGFGIRGRHIDPEHAEFIEFTAQTRMSGIDLDGHSIRKGAGDAIVALGTAAGRSGAAGAREGDAGRLGPGRHPSCGRARQPGPRRHPSQGHRQGRHPRTVRPDCAPWGSARS